MNVQRSVISREILHDVSVRASTMESERQVGDVVVGVLCEKYIDPRAVPLEDVKALVIHAIAAYRQESAGEAQVAV